MKFLKQPVYPFHVNQTFGDNLPCVKIENKPLNKRKIVTGKDNLTCPVGYEKLYPRIGLPEGHNGADLRATHGQPVYSSCEGYVEEVQTEEARGLGLGIITQKKYYCNELKTETQFKIRYWHLLKFVVKKGDIVKQGDLIGYADNTGYSSGDHLHWEVKPVEVRNGFVYNLLQDNGFYGAVDPVQYLETQQYEAHIFKDMKLFETSKEVEYMQDILIKTGLLNLEQPTGYYGFSTQVAIIKLQFNNKIKTNFGLSVNGATLLKLTELSFALYA